MSGAFLDPLLWERTRVGGFSLFFIFPPFFFPLPVILFIPFPEKLTETEWIFLQT